jgi:hypothetical protein
MNLPDLKLILNQFHQLSPNWWTESALFEAPVSLHWARIDYAQEFFALKPFFLLELGDRI